MFTSIIGLTAAALTTIAFLPQAIKTWKTKSTDDLSPLMFSLLCSGIILWLVYGIIRKDLPMILANSVTICIASVIMYFIIFNVKSRKVHHIGIWTNNLDKMKSFYTQTFAASCGEKYYNPKRGFSSYFINFTSGCQIELMHQPDMEQKNVSNGHIAISLGSKEQVDKYIEKLSKQNIEILSYPRTTGDGYYEASIKDIEGNIIELTV